MKLPCTDLITNQPEKYALTSDFCEVFTEEMNSLYLLCFLLTGDHEKAEKCFVAGLEDSTKGNSVFKQWARSWAKRMIVENAVRIIAPRPNHTKRTFLAAHLEPNSKSGRDREVLIQTVLDLPGFERFVFVMSVLERYSDQDCSVLLGCTLQEISEARLRACLQVAESYTKSDVADPAELIHRGNHSAEALVH
jgi:DNA-directed RNA polymerase specialized sigma24 family protein